MSIRSDNASAEQAFSSLNEAASDTLKSIAGHINCEQDNVRACVARLENIMLRAGFYTGEEEKTTPPPQVEPPQPQEVKWILQSSATSFARQVSRLNGLLELLENELT